MIEKKETPTDVDFFNFCKQFDTTHCTYAIRQQIPKTFYNYDFLTDIINSFPTLGFVYILRGYVSSLKKREEALQDLTKAQDLTPESPMVYVTRANFYYLNNKFEEALKDVEHSIKLDPTDPFPFFILSCIYFNQKKYNFALQEINRAIEIDPNFQQGYAARSQIYLVEKNFELAIQDLKKKLEINSQDEGCYREICRIYSINKRQQEAVEFLIMNRHILKENIFLRMRARVYFENGQYDLALQDLNNINRFPENEKDYCMLGEIYYEQGRYQEALEQFNCSIELNPDCDELYSWRATQYEMLGDTENALQDLRTAISLDSKEEYYEELAELLKSSNKLEEAIKCLDEGIECHSKSKYLHFLRSKFHFDDKNYLKGDNDLYRAISLTNKNKYPEYKTMLEEHRENHYLKMLKEYRKFDELKEKSFGHNEKLRQHNIHIKNINQILREMNAKELISKQFITPSSLKFLCKIAVATNFSQENIKVLPEDLKSYVYADMIKELEPIEETMATEPPGKNMKCI